MNRDLLPALIVACLSLLSFPLSATESITFETDDEVTIYGELYRADVDTNAPMILLFHQGGGDARGEYGPIVPRLNEAGYHAIAIDQRRGGDRFGQSNRTVEGLIDAEYGYCDAYPDLKATLSKVRELGFEGPLVAWGSSYSAALVFRLAAEYPEDIAAVLAFSPGSSGPLADCPPKLYSADLEMPVLALRPISEMEAPSVPPQLERLRSEGHSTYVADPGVHGSSMLVSERVGAETDQTWSAVLAFIEEALD